MNEPKHTPGPWMIDRHADNGELVVRCHSDKKIVANCQTDFYSSGSREKLTIEIQANARLIAAAPELLEALQNIVGTYNDSERWTQGDEPEPVEIQAARAAIAKATGDAQK